MVSTFFKVLVLGLWNFQCFGNNDCKKLFLYLFGSKGCLYSIVTSNVNLFSKMTHCRRNGKTVYIMIWGNDCGAFFYRTDLFSYYHE